MDPKRLLLGFVAGFLAVLTVHQLVVAILWSLGAIPFPPYSFAPRAPFGVPAILSLAFWGGVWGVVIAAVADRRPDWNPVLVGLVIGAVFCVLVGWTVVAALRGQPMMAGWNLARWWPSILINGAFGAAAGLFYALLARRRTRA
ncbi:MAG TPA: hypothetical protein VD970_11080 [Acetobacteraceae bacterium]|nr:hypothetical protein [Acetobacteraceae bacterium]